MIFFRKFQSRLHKSLTIIIYNHRQGVDRHSNVPNNFNLMVIIVAY